MNNMAKAFTAGEKKAHDNFFHESSVEQAQEKILQVTSLQEIKDLLKQDDLKNPSVTKDYNHKALAKLVTENIMKHFSNEEIAHVENLSKSPEKNNEFVSEYSKLSKKIDDSTSRAFFEIATSKFKSTDINDALQDTISNHIKKYPDIVDDIYEDIWANIKQNKWNEQHGVEKQIEVARKTGYVQGVCECVAAIGDDHALGKKLLTEMNVSRDMAKKFANPETFKQLEQGIFAQTQEQKLEQTQGIKI